MSANKLKNIFSMKNDEKSYLLGEYSIEYGYQITDSYFKRDALFFVFLIFELLKLNKPQAVTFRYFNDHPNIFRALLLATNIVVTAMLCKVFKIKVLWILHNVDKESAENYPRITSQLRKLVGSWASKIFVTDPFLIAFAANKYPQWKEKFDFITFGIRKDKLGICTDDGLLKLLSSLKSFRQEGGFVVFCPTAGTQKHIHLAQAPQLMAKAKELGLKYKLVIVGDLHGFFLNNPCLEKNIKKDNDIMLLNRYVKYDAEAIASYIDFYWRALSDQSISFTLYEAASIKKPILTLDKGFMGKAVEKYNMGVALKDGMTDLLEKHECLLSWNEINATKFLETHSWKVAAQKLCNALH